MLQDTTERTTPRKDVQPNGVAVEPYREELFGRVPEGGQSWPEQI